MNNEWIQTSISEVAEVVGGGTPSTTRPEYWGNDHVWLTPTEVAAVDGQLIGSSKRMISDAGLANSSAKLLPKDTVLLTSRATVGFVALAGIPVSTNQGFQSLVCGNRILPKFMLFWIQANREAFTSRAAGSTFKEISPTNVRSIKILLPPLDVQRRIVDVIEHVDGVIKTATDAREKTRTARAALLANLLNPETNPFIDSKQPAMNNEYRDVALEDVAAVIMGQSPPGSSYNQEGEGLPFMQGSAEFGIHYPSPVKYTTAPAKVARNGDILISVRAPVGDTNFADQEIAIGRGLGIVRANPDNETRFLRLALQLQVDRLISVSGSGMFASITGTNLKGFKFAVPPLNVQRRIVDVIEDVDRVIAEQSTVIDRARLTRSAILADLLSGNHEVPDSYDELLEAI